MIRQLVANGWLLGKPENYNRELALYEEDLLGFVQDTQPEEWQKYCKLYPNNPEQKFVERVAQQLNKADPNAAHKEMRTFGTLGVLRHPIKDRGTRFNLCQFKPEHDLNPDTLARYEKNRLRVVPELVYSPWATDEYETETGVRAKKWRIDLAYGTVVVQTAHVVVGGTGAYNDALIVNTPTDVNSIAFDPVPPPHVPKAYTGGKRNASIAGTKQIDVHERNPRLGYRITASLQRNGEWIPFKSKIVQMDDIDMIRQEYVNHTLAVPKRNEFVDIPTSVSPFIVGKWSDTSYSKMRAGQMQKNAKEIHKLYVVQRNKYTATTPLNDLDGYAMPVITAGIRLTSGWRNPERNEFYSTAKGSKHQLANALDMAPPRAIAGDFKKPNTRKAAAFYWILWKAKLSGDVTGQLEDKNSKKLKGADFKDKFPKNGIPDAYEKAKHLHIQ